MNLLFSRFRCQSNNNWKRHARHLKRSSGFIRSWKMVMLFFFKSAFIGINCTLWMDGGWLTSMFYCLRLQNKPYTFFYFNVLSTIFFFSFLRTKKVCYRLWLISIQSWTINKRTATATTTENIDTGKKKKSVFCSRQQDLFVVLRAQRLCSHFVDNKLVCFIRWYTHSCILN